MTSRCRFALVLLGLCLLGTGCDKHYQYKSIWQRVYGSIPPYQEKIEAMEVVKE
jgi:hypothetical protein